MAYTIKTPHHEYSYTHKTSLLQLTVTASKEFINHCQHCVVEIAKSWQEVCNRVGVGWTDLRNKSDTQLTIPKSYFKNTLTLHTIFFVLVNTDRHLSKLLVKIFQIKLL